MATHGVFAGEANEVLAASPLERIVITDTIAAFRLTDCGLKSRLEVVPVAGLVAAAIDRLHSCGSIMELGP